MKRTHKIIIVIVIFIIITIFLSISISTATYFLNKSNNQVNDNNSSLPKNATAWTDSKGIYNKYEMDNFDYYQLITNFKYGQDGSIKGKISDGNLIDIMNKEATRQGIPDFKLQIGGVYNFDESSIKYQVILPDKNDIFIASNNPIENMLIIGLPLGSTIIYNSPDKNKITINVNESTKKTASGK